MMLRSRDSYSRTQLLELEDGLTLEEADLRVRDYVIQIDIGRSALTSRTRQAAALTAVNCAWRAAPGGVNVRLAEDGVCLIPWGQADALSATITRFGGTLVDELRPDKPTVVIGGDDDRPPGSVVVWATWHNWAGGVADEPGARMSELGEMELAGVLSGALGVSEALQHLRGYVLAGRRTAGISLWRPDLDWRAADAAGPALQFLPSRLWLAGLGHLGQAYGWALGLLPYADLGDLKVMLQDYERIVDANESTGLLTFPGDVGKRKTRIVAARLDDVGFETYITERRFDRTTEPQIDFDEPGVVLSGFDDARPRRQLEDVGFAHIVDAGLGVGSVHYLDMLVHTFPGASPAVDCFPDIERKAPDVLAPNYEAEIRRRIESGEDAGDARCGVMMLAGAAAAAAFVGAATATIVVGDVLRTLHQGSRYDVVSLSLRSFARTAAESRVTKLGTGSSAPIRVSDAATVA